MTEYKAMRQQLRSNNGAMVIIVKHSLIVVHCFLRSVLVVFRMFPFAELRHFPVDEPVEKSADLWPHRLKLEDCCEFAQTSDDMALHGAAHLYFLLNKDITFDEEDAVRKKVYQFLHQPESKAFHSRHAGFMSQTQWPNVNALKRLILAHTSFCNPVCLYLLASFLKCHVSVVFLHSVWSTCFRGGVGGSTLVLCKTVNGFSLCKRISVTDLISDLPLSPCVPVLMCVQAVTPAQQSDTVHAQAQTEAMHVPTVTPAQQSDTLRVQAQTELVEPMRMSMTEELCALVAESKSATASADSGSEEADAEVRVKSEICSDVELIEVECNAQLMSQPFVVLRDVLKHDVSSPVGEPVHPEPHKQLLLPLEAHLEDEPEVDDLFPQVHEDRASEVKRVTRKRPVSVVAPAPSSVRSDVSVDRLSVRKRCGKSATLPRPQASAQSASASVCDDDLPLSVLRDKWAKRSGTSVSVVSDKGAEGSKQGMKRKTSMRDTCEDDIPLSVLRDKWASETAGEKQSASVKRSRSVKCKVTVMRGKRVTQSVKRTVTCYSREACDSVCEMESVCYS